MNIIINLDNEKELPKLPEKYMTFARAILCIFGSHTFGLLEIKLELGLRDGNELASQEVAHMVRILQKNGFLIFVGEYKKGFPKRLRCHTLFRDTFSDVYHITGFTRDETLDQDNTQWLKIYKEQMRLDYKRKEAIVSELGIATPGPDSWDKFEDNIEGHQPKRTIVKVKLEDVPKFDGFALLINMLTTIGLKTKNDETLKQEAENEKHQLSTLEQNAIQLLYDNFVDGSIYQAFHYSTAESILLREKYVVNLTIARRILNSLARKGCIILTSDAAWALDKKRYQLNPDSKRFLALTHRVNKDEKMNCFEQIFGKPSNINNYAPA